MLRVKTDATFLAGSLSKGRLQLFNERAVSIAEHVGSTPVEGEDQRLLVDRNAILVHKEHEDEATTLVGAWLSGIFFFPIVIKE